MSFAIGHTINIGRKMSEETKQKISNTLAGHNVADKTKEKISFKNKGYKHTEEAKNKISLSRKGIIVDEKHSSWKGDDVGYQALHTWIRKKYGKAKKCEFQDETCKGRFEWSNISKEYNRDLTDFQQLCSSHHVRYDKKQKTVGLSA